MRALGEVQRGHYLIFPPSHAVDGQSETAFCSLESKLNSCSKFLILYFFCLGAMEQDIISLDLQAGIKRDWRDVEMSWLVDEATRAILQVSKFETSLDGLHWVTTISFILSIA
jgi:hypothetical protein